MENNRKKISLKDFDKNVRGIKNVRKLIFEVFGKRYFEFQSLEQLIWQGLKLIEETNFVENNSESLAEGMKIVRDYYDYPVPNRIKSKNDRLEELKDFSYLLFDMRRVPYSHLQEIKRDVEWDLKSINELIEHYETLPQIKSLLEGDAREASKSHMITHFYGKCVVERKRILNYYLEGMYAEAKFRATMGDTGWTSSVLLLNHGFNPPYNYGKSFFRRNYDYRKIDQVSHRLYATNIFIDEVEDYEELYKTDKNSFYLKLFQSKTPSKFFEEINYSISLIRLSEERKEIFKELERLFYAQEWLAFYAISLPQVEGLFADMVGLEKSGENRHALSAKVRAVRSFSDSNERTFDYYEYVLPQLRNLFAHGELVGDYELRAYDLLTDLEKVLNIYSNLNNPFVQVSRLLARKNIIDFPDIDSIATYLHTLSKLKPAQRKQLKNEISDFNENFLLKECQLESVVKQGFIDFKRHLEQLDLNFSGSDDEYDLPSLNQRGQIRDKITDSNKDYLEMTFMHSDNEICEVLVLDDLMRGIEQWISKNSETDFLKEQIDEWKNNSLIFRNLRELKNLLTEESNDD